MEYLIHQAVVLEYLPDQTVALTTGDLIAEKHRFFGSEIDGKMLPVVVANLRSADHEPHSVVFRVLIIATFLFGVFQQGAELLALVRKPTPELGKGDLRG